MKYNMQNMSGSMPFLAGAGKPAQNTKEPSSGYRILTGDIAMKRKRKLSSHTKGTVQSIESILEIVLLCVLYYVFWRQGL